MRHTLLTVGWGISLTAVLTGCDSEENGKDDDGKVDDGGVDDGDVGDGDGDDGNVDEGDVVIPYNEYSQTPTIGRGTGTSTDPSDPGYGAMRFFIENVVDYTDDRGADALPAGQRVAFQPDQDTGREISALRAGIQFANKNGQEPLFSVPSWGFIYNSWPFGIRFEQMVEFLYEAEIELDGFRGNGIELAQWVLDGRGGTQIVLPVLGSTMQGSGYFPKPIGTPDCSADDDECLSQGRGIGLEGLCTTDWRIRFLDAPQDILDIACDLLVERGVISEQTLQFYPPVGGESVLLPMQRRAAQGFEFTVPLDDLLEFFPVKKATATNPLGNPDAGDLDCSPALEFPLPEGLESNCSQNIGQIGARYAHSPSWHQPYLIAWIHIDKDVWNGLSAAQRAAIERAARDSLVQSYNATESVQCARLQDILEINRGIVQRNVDGTPRLVDGEPVSAAMVLATWPDDALDVLREARDEFFASLEGPDDPGERTDEEQDFSVIWGAARAFTERIGAEEFDPGTFPATTGLLPGEECNLVR